MALQSPFTLSLSKGEIYQGIPFMVRQAHHERIAKISLRHNASLLHTSISGDLQGGTLPLFDRRGRIIIEAIVHSSHWYLSSVDSDRLRPSQRGFDSGRHSGKVLPWRTDRNQLAAPYPLLAGVLFYDSDES